MSFTKKHLQAALALLCIIAFFPVLNADFVLYDDPEYVQNNSYIRTLSIEHFKAIFQGKASDIYVPFTILSYALEYTVFGLNAKVFHSINLLLHICNALLLLEILEKLGVKNKIHTALLVAFFTLNPLVTESVCWITERKDVLYCLFFFLSALQYLQYVQKGMRKNIWLSFIFFLCACLSKPMAISLPVLFAIYLFYLYKKQQAKQWLKLIPFFLIAAIIAYINLTIIQSRTQYTNFITEYNFFGKVMLLLSESGYYFMKPFFPFHQQLIHFFPENHTLFKGQFFYYAIAGLIAFTFIIWFIVKTKSRIITGLFLAWLVMLLPVIQVVANTHSYISERYFYVTILFPVAIVLSILKYYQIKLSSHYLLPLSLSLLFAFGTFKRSSVWKNTKTLFEQELKSNPENHLALNNLGLYYNKQSAFNKSLPLLEKAVKLEPENDLYLNNYAWALAATGQADTALVYFKKAVLANPNNTDVLSNTGICYMQLKQANKAYMYFKRAYDLNPQHPDVLYNLGLYYFNARHCAKAKPLFSKALKLGKMQAEKYLKKCENF